MKTRSLRTKLLIAMLCLPAFAILGYHLLAQKLFVSDKIAGVFDSSLAMTKASTALALNELDRFKSEGEQYVSSYDAQIEKSAETPLPVGIKAIASTSGLKRASGLEAESATFFEGRWAIAASLLGNDDQMVLAMPSGSKDLLMLERMGPSDSSSRPIIAIVLNGETISRLFGKKHLMMSYLVNRDGAVVFGPSDAIRAPVSKEIRAANMKEILSGSAADGASEMTNARGQELIAAHARLKPYGLTVFFAADKASLLVQVRLLVLKAILLFIAMLACAVVINYFVTRSFSANIEKLSAAVKKIGLGELDTPIDVQSEDEIGILAQGMRKMTGDIRNLMSESEKTAKLASDMETARLVQNTLFPSAHWQGDGFEVNGHSQSADRCGGDWWFHQIMHGSLYLWVADVTGHGISAALLTSAARASASVIERIPEMPIRDCMSLMNSSIHATARGKWQMTMFMARIHLETGLMTYSNASHTWPIVLKASEEKLSSRSFIELAEAIGSRMGETATTPYEESTYQLEKGDRLFVYTDGILDIQNPNGEICAERQVWKYFCTALNETPANAEALKRFQASLEGYRKGASHIDDETYVLLEYKGA